LDILPRSEKKFSVRKMTSATKQINVPYYEGWNFNSGNYLFTTDTK